MMAAKVRSEVIMEKMEGASPFNSSPEIGNG
jgi:hypothetical protein